jgi:hypothetical protein
MGAPLPNERMDASDSALPMFESKGGRSRASSAKQPDTPEGMVLPWLMTMPSPDEDIKIGNIRTRPDDEKLDTAQPDDAPQGPTSVTQLMLMPEGPSSVSPEFPTTGEDAAVPPHPGKPGVIAPWLSTTPLLADAICEKRNATETYAALKRLLSIAEHESGNFYSAPENSAERPDACAPELPPAAAGLELSEEIANGDTPPTYVVPEADIETQGNPHAAQDWETEKSAEELDGRNGLDVLWPRANPPVVEDEIGSTENQLERSWIQAVSLVPDAPNGVVDGFKLSDVAETTQSSSRQGSLTILIAIIFTASALGIGAAGLRPFSNLARLAEMPPSLASVSPKEEPVGSEVQNVQEGLGRSETSSQPPIVSSPPASSGGAGTSVATQPSPDDSPRSTPIPPTPTPKPENGSDSENSVALASSEQFARPAQAPQQVGAPLAWQNFEVPEFGTRVQIPAGIFIPAGKPRLGSGQRFERADGRAVLSIYSRPNNTGESPATYLRQNLRVDRSALDYERIARSFFAVSLERDGVILYSRCNFSSRARAAIHCFDLTYPQEEKRSWDAVVTRISLSLRPLEG